MTEIDESGDLRRPSSITKIFIKLTLDTWFVDNLMGFHLFDDLIVTIYILYMSNLNQQVNGNFPTSNSLNKIDFNQLRLCLLPSHLSN